MTHGKDRTAEVTLEKSRLEFLVDGIFAIAMTILVLELRPPEIADRRSVTELAEALLHHGFAFGSYLLSFVVLGILWYRHNVMFQYLRHFTRTILAIQLGQLALTGFFPFCVALLGRFPTNALAQLVYVLCLTLYMWLMLLHWVSARRSGSLVESLPANQAAKMQKRILRVVIMMSVLSIFYASRAIFS